LKYATILIDFENAYYFVKNRAAAGPDPANAIVELVSNLRDRLQVMHGERSIIMHAYADFERIDESTQGPLYLLGVETHNVLGTEHKNAADMRLCIDAMDILYTRPDIDSFVLVCGDRDYIPVIQHLKKRAKTVRIVGFPGSISGDLLNVVGKEFLIDATDLLNQDVQREMRTPAQPIAKPAAPAKTMKVATAPPVVPPDVQFEPVKPLPERELGELRHALEVMLRHFGTKKEVWMVPYLHRLRNELSYLDESERRDAIRSLEQHGAIKVQRRQGDQNPYSVILINWNHPEVRSLHPGM
jgi:uncharacterized LabA/DUF88 family protein